MFCAADTITVDTTQWLIIAQLLLALFMTGVIWTVQLVIYPQFRDVGETAFRDYHQEYMKRISWIVVPLMLAEMAFAILLALWADDTMRPMAVTALALVLGAWGSTAFLQVPLHKKLGRCYTVGAHRSLVWSNWLRTAFWSARSVYLFCWLVSLSPQSMKSLAFTEACGSKLGLGLAGLIS